MSHKSKILILVEGEKRDVRLMARLLRTYNIYSNHQIVSYNTNIYNLYEKMFQDGDPASIDLLQLLKSHEPDIDKKAIFDNRYSDILLVFDLDPHAPEFSPSKIMKMMRFFVESSDMGKLYLNDPMVEAFYHMKNIPDENFDTYVVKMDDMSGYKKRVGQENRNHDYKKFASSRMECNLVIRQNLSKAYKIANVVSSTNDTDGVTPNSTLILQEQLRSIEMSNYISVLCTCAFYIVDYNPTLILTS